MGIVHLQDPCKILRHLRQKLTSSSRDILPIAIHSEIASLSHNTIVLLRTCTVKSRTSRKCYSVHNCHASYNNADQLTWFCGCIAYQWLDCVLYFVRVLCTPHDNGSEDLYHGVIYILCTSSTVRRSFDMKVAIADWLNAIYVHAFYVSVFCSAVLLEWYVGYSVRCKSYLGLFLD